MKNPKTLRKYNGFVLPDAKNQIFPLFFCIFMKIQKTMEIQKSKTFRDCPESFGFLDFAENPRIQKPKTPKIQKSQRFS